jgi:cytochrome b6-f complex iron-sulfur subunit
MKKKRNVKTIAKAMDVSQDETSRRGFLNRLWVALGLVALGEFLWMALSFTRPNKGAASKSLAGTMVSAGSIESFASGSVTAFQRGAFYLVRLEDGGFLALSCKCTHLGCTVPWVEKDRKFICPCHASTFDMTGNVISGPAGRPLDLFPITIENKVVKVDAGRRIKRGGFRPDQVTYSKNI